MMYQFLRIPYAPVILLGMVLAVLDITAGIRCSDGMAKGLLRLWHTDHWPGTEKKAELRGQAGQWCFLLAMLAYLAWNTMSNSCLPAFVAASGTMYWLSLLLCLIKILLLTSYSYQGLALALVCLLPLLCAAAYAQNMVFLALFFLLLAAKNVKMRPVLQAGATLTAVLAGVVILSQRLGLILMDGLGEDNYLRTFQHKFALGFIHPNTTGYILAFVAIAWYLLRYNRLKWWDYGGILGLTAVAGGVCKSRTSMLALVILLVLGTMFRVLRNLRRQKWLHVLLCTAPGLLAAASFLATACFDENSALWDKLNGLTSGRLYLCRETFLTFGPTWFGQNVRTEKLFTLDNVYLYLFYRLGVLCFALFLAGMTILLWNFLRRECYGEAAALLAVLCMGIMECVVFWPAVSLAMWQLPAVIWNEKVEPLCVGPNLWQAARRNIRKGD